MKFIFDEAGAKSIKDTKENLGVVAGFFLSEEKEEVIVEKVNSILNKYKIIDLLREKKLKKIHISEINIVNKDFGSKIKEEIFSLLNDLEIVWTFAAVKKSNSKIFNNNRKKVPNCIREGSLLEYLYVRIFINIIDFNNMFKLDCILVTDQVDKKIIKNFKEYFDNITSKEKKKIKNTIIKCKQNISSEIEKFKKSLEIKIDDSPNNVLSFISDLITSETYKILKRIPENKYLTQKEYMDRHPCKYLFLLGEDNEENNIDDWIYNDLGEILNEEK